MTTRESIEVWFCAPNFTQVLLLHYRKAGDARQFWQPLTGGIEPGETAVQAAIRETQEELELNITTRQLQYCSELTVAITADFNVHKRLFWCQIDQQPLQVNPHEHDRAAWFKDADVAKQLYWASNQQTWQMVQEAIWR